MVRLAVRIMWQPATTSNSGDLLTEIDVNKNWGLLWMMMNLADLKDFKIIEFGRPQAILLQLVQDGDRKCTI